MTNLVIDSILVNGRKAQCNSQTLEKNILLGSRLLQVGTFLVQTSKTIPDDKEIVLTLRLRKVKQKRLNKPTKIEGLRLPTKEEPAVVISIN